MGRKALDRQKTAETIARLRQLLPLYGPSGAAKAIGKSKQWVCDVQKGRRHSDLTRLSISNLELRFSSKLCTKCGNSPGIVTKTCLCVNCTLLEMAKDGTIYVAPERLDKGSLQKVG